LRDYLDNLRAKLPVAQEGLVVFGNVTFKLERSLKLTRVVRLWRSPFLQTIERNLRYPKTGIKRNRNLS